jgi:surface antigen
LKRLTLAMIVWCTAVGSLQGFPTFSLSNSNQNWQIVQGLASNPSRGEVKPAAVAPANAATTLATGPTGQLMPPGTMAADRTFANSYARGQCTWYVAGRRQIPSNWGNARSWYTNAQAAHWSTGTVPAVAAIAWTPFGRYGHVALVEQVSPDGRQVYISEMNNLGLYVKSYRWVSTSDFKYIY